MQLSLFAILTTPLAGDLVTSIDVFEEHVCEEVRECPFAKSCMLQPIGPGAMCEKLRLLSIVRVSTPARPLGETPAGAQER